MRRAYQYDLDGKFVAEYKSIVEATLAMGLNRNNVAIHNAIGVDGKVSCGYQWRYEKNDFILPISTYSTRKNVAMYDKTGRLLRTFSNTDEAAQYVNKTHSAIEKTCNQRTAFCSGFIFRYYNNVPDDIIIVPKLSPRGRKHRKVAQYTKDGELVKVYESVAIAAKEFDSDTSLLYKCCKGSRKTYKGYMWKICNE